VALGFFFRLVPPRPDFAFTMSDDERGAMLAHVEYWTGLANAGSVVAFGPVDDAAGPFGIGIVVTEDRAAAEALRDADPVMQALDGFRTEISPMLQLVTPGDVYPAP
jgi:hypothetical protein